ncbi:MAG: short-chain dehydrogenase [Gemmatimonadetes bacterium]|nr:short-chain dehydrogenase [Gemmatimonadota bacterium]
MSAYGSLEGKRVVVLGGTSGLGLAAAKAAATDGANVVVASSRQASVDAALRELESLGSHASVDGHVVNLANEAEVRGFFESTGDFDHLIYTAGEAIRLGELASTDLAKARDYFDVRLWGALAAVKYAAPHIARGGSVVLTTGIAGQRPQRGWALGAMICNAIEGLTRAMAMELAPVRVNAVCPGVVRTPLWREMSDGERDAMFRNVGAALPVGRAGEAEDIAEAYMFLMRERYATGHVLVVDGGGLLV